MDDVLVEVEDADFLEVEDQVEEALTSHRMAEEVVIKTNHQQARY